MKNNIHIITSFIFVFALSAFVYAQPSSGQIGARVDRAVHEAAAGAARARSAGILSFSTTWQRCDVYEHRRGLRVGGKRGKVRVEYNCRDVVTRCGAVISQDKAYVSQSCYYARKNEAQNLHFKSAFLRYPDGSKVFFPSRSAVKSSDFVVFALK